jgi:hypothetical protein
MPPLSLACLFSFHYSDTPRSGKSQHCCHNNSGNGGGSGLEASGGGPYAAEKNQRQKIGCGSDLVGDFVFHDFILLIFF